MKKSESDKYRFATHADFRDDFGDVTAKRVPGGWLVNDGVVSSYVFVPFPRKYMLRVEKS